MRRVQFGGNSSTYMEGREVYGSSFVIPVIPQIYLISLCVMKLGLISRLATKSNATYLLLGVVSQASKNSSDDSDETDGNRATAAEAVNLEAMTTSPPSAAAASSTAERPQCRRPRFLFSFNLTLGGLILAPLSNSPSLPFLHTHSH